MPFSRQSLEAAHYGNTHSAHIGLKLNVCIRTASRPTIMSGALFYTLFISYSISGMFRDIFLVVHCHRCRCHCVVVVVVVGDQLHKKCTKIINISGRSEDKISHPICF